MKEKIQRFMMGRYGVDQFNKFLLVVLLILVLVGMFFPNIIITVLGMALLIYTYFRMLSRNIMNRRRENTIYQNAVFKVKNFFRAKPHNGKDVYVDSKARTIKNSKIFPCPKCSQKIRVPKGKGTIMITCPKCKHEFIKRT